MTVHFGERRSDDGTVDVLVLLGDELARLVEGTCPFWYGDVARYEPCDIGPGWHVTEPFRDPTGARLEVTSDGWARCSDGNEYRYPPQTPWVIAYAEEQKRRYPGFLMNGHG